jgi:hypothetical protein
LGYVVCFHPDHGIRIETTHEKPLCAPIHVNEKPGIQNNNKSCIDTPLLEKSSNIPNTLSIHRVLSSNFILALFIKVSVSTIGKVTSISPDKSSFSRHISTTILRI